MMYPIRGALRGRMGLEWLEEVGPYAVVTNKKLHAKGRASKFAVANPRERMVNSVHDSPNEAINQAQELYGGPVES